MTQPCPNCLRRTAILRVIERAGSSSPAKVPAAPQNQCPSHTCAKCSQPENASTPTATQP
ncbi:MAG: hypothetical protein QOF58_5014 [Pseudonocardiales bacterium]|jgi:hypothetical protein|nr:hypothetical protein [Pseudonocardiales bacterium]